MEIDIRIYDDIAIDSIRFSDGGAIKRHPDGNIYITDGTSEGYHLLTEDIGNLIKALDKAYDLWGEYEVE